jgi:hypothetical protein
MRRGAPQPLAGQACEGGLIVRDDLTFKNRIPTRIGKSSSQIVYGPEPSHRRVLIIQVIFKTSLPWHDLAKGLTLGFGSRPGPWLHYQPAALAKIRTAAMTICGNY